MRHPSLPRVSVGLLAVCLTGLPVLKTGARSDKPAIVAASAASAASATGAHVLTSYCGGCHQSGRAKIDFDDPDDPTFLQRDRGTWKKALRLVRDGKMPPAGMPQPSPEDREVLLRWIEEGLSQSATEDTGNLLARRLTRSEYVNTIRDLLGVPFQPAHDFPTDERYWRRCGATPAVAPAALAPYQAAADTIAADAATLLRAVGRPMATAELHDIRAALAEIAHRAFRRPLTSDENATANAALDNALESGIGMDAAIQAALREVLTSPQFLYRVDPLNDAEQGSVASEFALASRLSYFLWHSMPDEELLALAAANRLRAELPRQAQRLLRDPRARAFIASFASYWLELPKLDLTGVEDELSLAMRQETEMFVEHIFRDDRNVLEFLDADYTFLNERLARHYGIAGVEGQQMRRVSVAGTSRGGLATQASMLCLTSDGGGTSPVRRGKWILDNLLGTPPPPPPSGILEELAKTRRSFERGSTRQLLERHAAEPGCANCHSKIDPIGFSLENFDALGAWRAQGLFGPIDAAVVMPTGEAIDGPAALKAHLRQKKDLFLRCLADKLLRHATSGRLTDADTEHLEELAEHAGAADYHFSAVLSHVMQSPSFLDGPARRLP